LHADQIDQKVVSRFKDVHKEDYRLWEHVMKSEKSVIGRSVD
jgi:hypothetical protein